MYDIQQIRFINRCVKDESLIKNIDNFIDEWHDGDFEEELHEFLGMSWNEYALWVSDPDILPYIVKARKENRYVDDISQEVYKVQAS